MGALACGLVAMVVAGASGKAMETTLQDDAVFLHRAPALVRAAAHRVAALGADRVRITAGWSAIAPRPDARRMPGGRFRGSDPATYPAGAWAAVDTAVRASRDAGLKVQLDIAFWAPRWAVGRASPAGRHRWWPDPRLFGDFAHAVAQRYHGQVDMYTPWNEPNHLAFLAPQWTSDGNGGYRPESPHLYRAMYVAAWDAIKSVDRSNVVLLGNTSAQGSAVPGHGGVAPLQFVRALACVDDKLQPLDVPECRHFQPLQADGYAHHPYSRYTTPATPSPFSEDVSIADSGRLEELLKALALRGRITTDLPLYDTEYGYESSQDDPFAPFDRAQQATYLSWASYLAWQDPQTRMFAQFLLRDIDPRESGRPRGTASYYRDWQSGLYDNRGRAKPAATAFRLPFWAERHEDPAEGGPVLLLWGQVRPGSGVQTVRIEQRTGDRWVPVTTWGRTCDASEAAFYTDRQGVFARAMPAGTEPADYRFAWHRPDGSWEPSEPVAPAAT